MTTTRHSSTDSINIPGWGWQPFLEDAVQALQPLNLAPYPVANDFLYRWKIIHCKLCDKMTI